MGNGRECTVSVYTALQSRTRVGLYGPSGCEEHLLNISSAGLQALFYFSWWSFLFVDHKKGGEKAAESAGEGDKEKRINEF